jgi:hypothetical protein
MIQDKELRHKLNNLISVISLSTYKLEKIADKYEDDELTDIVFKLNETISKIKDLISRK